MDRHIMDISLPIKPGMITYPGNAEVEIESKKTGHSIISTVTLGSHTGTHVDAPKHANEMGLPVDELELHRMMGPCRVLNLTHVEKSISVTEIKKHNIQKGERIIVKTHNSTRGFDEFYDDYIYLEGSAAKYLGERGILMFGTDYLSVKQRGSDDNSAHTELLKHGIPIFEGLDLSKVRPGNYIFFGLPLKLEGIDGAPARCVLMPN